MLALTPLVEPLSIDEAFLDLAGCEGINGASAAETLARFARRVEQEIGVTVSVGLSYCKFLAKLASDLDKPRGFAVLRREEAKAWLAPQSVGRLWGVGRAGQERLERLGFRTIGDLQRVDEWSRGLAPRRRRATPLAPGAGNRRSAGAPRPRSKERIERDHIRPRRRRQGGADARAARPLRASRGASAQRGAFGREASR